MSHQRGGKGGQDGGSLLDPEVPEAVVLAAGKPVITLPKLLAGLQTIKELLH